MQTKQKSISDKAGLISISRFSENLVNIVIAVVLSRILLKQDYGTYRQVILVVHTLISILMLGLPLSVYFFIPRLTDERKKGFALQTTLLMSALGLILAFLLFMFSGFIANKFNNPSLSFYLKIIAFYGWLILPTLFVESFLISLDKIKLAFLSTLLMNIGRFIAIILAIVLYDSLTSIFVAYVVYAAIASIVLIFLSFNSLKGIKLKFEFSSVLDQLKYAVPLGLSDVIDVLAREIDKIFISLFFVASEYAVYANGAINVPFIRAITGAVIAVLLPKFVTFYKDNQGEKLLELWHESIRRISLLFLPLMFFLIIFAEDIMVILFSSKYLQSAVPFRIYTVGLAVMVTLWANILAAMGFTKDILKISAISLLLNIILNYIFIHVFGFIGPAIGTIIQRYITTIIFLIFISKRLNVSFSRVFPWKSYGSILLVSGVCAIPLLSLWKINITMVQRIIIGTLGYLVILYIVGRSSKIIKARDIDLIKRWKYKLKFW